MQSVRRKTLSISPISVVRSSLVFNPVASVVAPEEGAFSDVLVDVIGAARSIDNANVYRSETEYRVEARIKAQSEQAAIAPPEPWSPYSGKPVDLYVKLEALLREKSFLIAVV